MEIHGDKFPARRWISSAGLSLAMLFFFLWLLEHQLQELDLAAIRGAMAQVGPLAFLLAILATGLSFWAVGQYDLTLHRHLGTGLAPPQAIRAGILAIALGQTIGMGLLTGTMVRFRLLPGLSLACAGRLTLAVTIGFLTGWLVVSSATFALLTQGQGQTLGVVGLGLSTMALASTLHPRAPALWPNALTLIRCIFLAAVDLGAAALALWLLWPGDIAFTLLLPAFLLAFGGGLLSGSPAGLGVFEISLLAFLPGDKAALLCAVLLWRLVYYLGPALLAAAALLLLDRFPPSRPPTEPTCGPRPAGTDLAQGPNGLEWRQGLLLGRTRHALIALPTPDQSFPALQTLARGEGRMPVLYHATPRQAAQARRLGMQVLPIAAEAIIQPQVFTTEGPLRAGLRRKLRKAASAPITVKAAGPWWPIQDMERISAAWIQAHGGERRFSIGGWCPDRIRQQRVWLAQDAQGLIGFVSFATGCDGWKLDLMRHRPAPPDGTMAALICAAIAAARAEGITRLSLDHVPDPEALERCLPSWLAHPILKPLHHGSDGLRQFKQGFAPRWERRYLVAPGHFGLAWASAEIAHALRPQSPPSPANVQPLHDHHAESGFALAPMTWQDRVPDCGRA